MGACHLNHSVEGICWCEAKKFIGRKKQHVYFDCIGKNKNHHSVTSSFQNRFGFETAIFGLAVFCLVGLGMIAKRNKTVGQKPFHKQAKMKAQSSRDDSYLSF